MAAIGADLLVRLTSGYWLFRRNDNQWAQWPCGRGCTPADCFGWDAEETTRLANQRIEAEHQGQAKRREG